MLELSKKGAQEFQGRGKNLLKSTKSTKMDCDHCTRRVEQMKWPRHKRGTGMRFDCVECCVVWLSKMTRDEMRLNAPVIEYQAGSEHMDKVRTAWKLTKLIDVLSH